MAGEVLEDVALARRVKALGRPIVFGQGTELLAARMYTGFQAIRRGWTKNLYALRDRRPGKALASAAELFLTSTGPALILAALILAGRPGSAAVAGLAAAVALLAEALFRQRRGFDARGALSAPLGGAVVTAFLLESAARSWLGLGVRWKDRRYT